ncbi:MAG: plasmid stabilization protein [Bacteroidetes bacterium]|nr:plasmid stabilization protein [Bacteroidota bacterium]MBL7104753.1 plasmid stabilization protein [Bacteroidales bacterium]
MEVQFYKGFERQIDIINQEKLLNQIKKAVKSVQEAKTLHDISNLEKLRGHKTANRIRIGFYYIKNTINFAAFGYHKDIYKHFP